MQKKTKARLYDTETGTIVKKVTYSFWGDPNGYETTLYTTPEGYYFLYTFGGETSPYPVEKITGYFVGRARKWLAMHE